MRTRFLSLVLLAASLAGCTGSPAVRFLRDYETLNSVSSFVVCRDYGCAANVPVSLSEQEWAQVRNAFASPPRDAAEERERIRHAIALMETYVGPKAGTEKDGPGAAIFNVARRGQLDCIDEAYNTSTYLLLMQAQNLFTWHVVGAPARRGKFIDRWPHNTATIVERGSGDQYTVDSWFGANGEMPDVVPLQAWMAGWHPPEA
jgi:hypothetical protein